MDGWMDRMSEMGMRKETEERGENPPHCRFVHHKFHMT
jgi:hypothetical protein